MTRKTGFKTWLLRQKDRQDPVGDLARDLKADVCAGALWSVESLERHVWAFHVSANIGMVMVALHKAWEEYKIA